MNLLDEPLIRSLLDEHISFYEVMNTFNIKTQVAFNLPSSMHGFVYVSKRGSYYIILNGRINYKTQCETFIHEVKHIIEDIPSIPYVIGIDMQHTEIENDTDIFNLFKNII